MSASVIHILVIHVLWNDHAKDCKFRNVVEASYIFRSSYFTAVIIPISGTKGSG